MTTQHEQHESSRKGEKSKAKLMWFKLLAGQHEGADPSWKPSREDNELAERRGVVPRPPTRKYKVGEFVASETDLVRTFGPEKFAYADQPRNAVDEEGTPRAAVLNSGAGVFPGGQVAEGHQITTGAPVTDATPGGRATGRDTRPEVDTFPPGHGTAAAALKEGAGKPGGPSDDDLEGMTVVELREHAQKNDIDTKGATHKADLIKAVKGHYKRK